MIPILYEQYETAFTSNGLGRLADCISCTVTEERNGIYECQFTYPVTGEMYPEIQEGRIIAVIHDDVMDIQPFDIYGHSAPLNGVVTFYAHHISYRLGSVILKPMQAASCVAALNAIPRNTYNRCPFTFWTDKAVSSQWENKVPSAVKAILGGQQGSILDVYGKGEYQWDKWLVRLYVNRGNDNGVSIRYGVNLTDILQDYDESGSYNAVAPYWINREDGTVVTLSKGIVSVNAGTRLVPWTTQSGEEITDRAGNTIYFKVSNPITPVPMDLSEAFETQPTEAQLEAEALRRLNSSEAWLPSENITVKFINLADTEEYRDVAALQRVSLCDKVSVYCGPLGVSAVKMQVIRVVYNVLTERYDEIELGKPKTSFAQSITAQVEEITQNMPTISMMQQAIGDATNHITGANGGHVRFMYDANGEMQEILIMDTDDVNTAVNVWRWNSGGFGFSSNGYAGPYNLAMTMDGAIVANMITAGKMMFNMLQGGTMTLGGDNNVNGVLELKNASGQKVIDLNKDGITIWNGSDRQFYIDTSGNATFAGNIVGGQISINNETFKVLSNGAMTAQNASINGSIISQGLDEYGAQCYTKIELGTIKIYGDDMLAYYLSLRGWNSEHGAGAMITTATEYLSISGCDLVRLSASNGSSPCTVNIDAMDVQIGSISSANAPSPLVVTGDTFYYYQEKSVNINGKINIKAQHSTSEYNPALSIEGNDAADTYYEVDRGAFFKITNGSSTDVAMHLAQRHAKFWDVTIDNLEVKGTKNRVVSTDQYDNRLLYCYETASPMFGDVGDAIIGEDGLCYVALDAVFAQTISTDRYQVFLQKYGAGDCWVKERKGGYFIVEGTPGLEFGWELKAKQKDFDQLRLGYKGMNYTAPTRAYDFTVQPEGYGIDAEQHIKTIQKERISA